MSSVLYETSCGHLFLAVPATIDLASTLSCRQCWSDMRITGVQIMENHASCRRPSCRFSRFTGMSRQSASIVATRHAQKTAHDVIVEFAANPAAVKERERIQKGKLL